MKNSALAYQTLDHIKAHPEEWNQGVWHCGTSHCFAGLVEVFTTGEDVSSESTWDVAEQALGLTTAEAVLLFDAYNTLADLEETVDSLFGPRQDALFKTGFYRANAYPIT